MKDSFRTSSAVQLALQNNSAVRTLRHDGQLCWLGTFNNMTLDYVSATKSGALEKYAALVTGLHFSAMQTACKQRIGALWWQALPSVGVHMWSVTCQDPVCV